MVKVSGDNVFVDQEETSGETTRPRRSERIRNSKSPQQLVEDKENVVNCSTPKKLKQKKGSRRGSASKKPLAQDPFSTLQDDTADEVFHWLDPREVALRTSLVSTHWRRLSAHRSLWASLRRRCPPGHGNDDIHWRIFYTPTQNVDAGHGDEAQCYRVLDRATGEITLAKCVQVSEENGVSRWLLREAAILWNTNHSCIVKLKGSAVDTTEAVLFFQDCGSTNLHRIACNGDNTPSAINNGEQVTNMKVTLDQLRQNFFRILSAVAECHAQQVIHRNVKPSKFLVDDEGVCWMTSFTSSLVNGGCIAPRQLMPRMGTTQYLAPEVLLGASDLELDYTTYSEKVDMWSAGLILAEMAAGGPLFVVDSEIDLLFSIFRLLGTPSETTWEGVSNLPCSIENFPQWTGKASAGLDKIFGVLGEDGCDLLSRLLTYDSKKRICAMDALRHPFFSSHNMIWNAPSITAVPKMVQQHLSATKVQVWATLCRREASIPVLGDFLSQKNVDEANVTPAMRAILIDWMNEISYSWFMRPERRALHAAVSCLDRYLAVADVRKENLQLVGATCYALAAKLEEAEVITSTGYVTISDGAFSKDDMQECEVAVAHALRCRVAFPTAADFEPLVAETLAIENGTEVWADAPVSLLAQMLNDAMLLKYQRTQQHRPSIVCCSAFIVASLTIAKKLPVAVLSACELRNYLSCVRDIYAVVEEMKVNSWNHAFRNPKFQRVHDTQLVDVEACIAELENMVFIR